MKVDLNLLTLFLAVAEERNFRAAADRLDVTRSAVSQGSDGSKTASARRCCCARRARCA